MLPQSLPFSKRNEIRLGSVSFFLTLHDEGNSIIYILKVVMSFQYVWNKKENNAAVIKKIWEFSV